MKNDRFPFGSLLLILANLAVASLILGDDLQAKRWGFVPTDPSVLSAFTSLFSHTSPIHLLANLVFLAAIGPALESAAGGLRVVAVYVLAGLIGTLTHLFATEFAQPLAAQYPLLGASSGVAGLIGYCWLRFHRRRVPILPRFRVPVYSLVIVWLGLQVWGGVSANQFYFGPVAYWAHLGGFLGGFVLGLVFGAGGQALEEAWQERLSESRDAGPEARVTAAREFLARHPGNLEAITHLADAFESIGDAAAEAEQLAKIIALEPGFDGCAAIRRLDALARLSAVPAARRLTAAQSIVATYPADASLLLQSLLSGDAATRPDALAMLAELRAASHPEEARGYASQLVGEFELSPQASALRKRRPELF